MIPCRNLGLNERIKIRAKHLENVIFYTLYVFYFQIFAKLAANVAVIMVISERDELGPSAPKAFNQTEELFYVKNVFKTLAHKIFAKIECSSETYMKSVWGILGDRKT